MLSLMVLNRGVRLDRVGGDRLTGSGVFDSLDGLRAGLAVGLPPGTTAGNFSFRTSQAFVALGFAANASASLDATAYLARAAPALCDGGPKQGCEADPADATLANLQAAVDGDGANQRNRHAVGDGKFWVAS
jgi:hypothetical protein